MNQLQTIIDASNAEMLADLLTELGALSVSLHQESTEEIFQINPGEEHFWQQTRVTALFSTTQNIQQIIEYVHRLLDPRLTFTCSPVIEKDWVRETQQQFKPQRFGQDLWVLPSWVDDRAFEGAIVKINPGLAFGTGTHPTTQLCLEWLASHPPKGQQVVDYGCGSGILALASLALGADRVIAVDHDPQAIQATRHNLRLNPFISDETLIAVFPPEIPSIKANLLIANILANPLIELANDITDLCNQGGRLILSGMLLHDVERVCHAYQENFLQEKIMEKSGWALAVLKLK